MGPTQSPSATGDSKKPGAGQRDPKNHNPARLDKAKVLALVRQQFELKAVCPVVQHVIAMTSSSESSVDDVAKAVQQDPALAIRVLKIANSSLFGAGRKVQTLVDAARRIGMSGVRDAVVGLDAIERFSQAEVGGLHPGYFWEHSLATAVLARVLGETVRAKNADNVFLAGLLHDVGRLILSSKLPVQYEWVLRTAAERNVDVAIAEREMFGLTHDEITEDFLNRLGVPLVVREASSLHPLPADRIKRAARDPQSALVVALANRLAKALVLGDSGNSVLCPVGDYVQSLGMNGEEISRVAKEAIQRTQQTELFYASQTETTSYKPLHRQLMKTTMCGVQLSVLNGEAAGGCLQLFFDRLGWLGTEVPTLAVVCAVGEDDLSDRLAELGELESSIGGKLPLVLGSPEASVGLPPQEAEDRPWARVPFPGRYQYIMRAVEDLSAAEALACQSPITS